MIEYRPFRNNDAPLLAEIWRSQAAHRGLMQPMSAAIFEDLVLANPIFDRLGLIVAVDQGRPSGFIHVGFGATQDEKHLSTELGVISMLLVRAPKPDPAIATELLRLGEQYLVSHGARAIIAGGSRRADPFYLGLYGGSELTGVLDSDSEGQAMYRAHGYQEVDRLRVLHRELAGFRLPVDRKQMQIGRRTQLSAQDDPPTRTWWEACTLGRFDRTLFTLESREGRAEVAHAMFWNMEPLATAWGFHTAGLLDLHVAESERHQGLATHLLGEAFRHLHSQSVAVVEAQVREANEIARKLFGKLGFQEVDQSAVYRKELARPAT
ncbi:MAG TPA: GNAT family N-acetyltransferase [Pirellulales bacterium]|nr:GNAT family N-acetyltransferase [Pirellulales bacterium]